MKEIFSPTETKILKIVGKRRIKIVDITKLVYKGKKKPVTANHTVATAIRRINLKCDYYKLSWSLCGSGFGRLGKTVWRA